MTVRIITMRSQSRKLPRSPHTSTKYPAIQSRFAPRKGPPTRRRYRSTCNTSPAVIVSLSPWGATLQGENAMDLGISGYLALEFMPL